MRASESTLTRKDLDKIAAILKKAMKSTSAKDMNQYFDLLSMLVDAMHQLKVTVEFDHEERIRALEEFLKET